MSFGYIASMRTKPTRRDDVVSILLSGTEGLKAAGCSSYVVGIDEQDPDVIWVTEVWASRESHAASLELPATREAIAKAMPMLTGEFTGQEVTIVGGLVP